MAVRRRAAAKKKKLKNLGKSKSTDTEEEEGDDDQDDSELYLTFFNGLKKFFILYRHTWYIFLLIDVTIDILTNRSDGLR